MLAYQCEEGHIEAAVVAAVGKAVLSVAGGVLATARGGRGGETLAGIAVGGAVGAVVDELVARVFTPRCGECGKPTVAINIDHLGDQTA